VVTENKLHCSITIYWLIEEYAHGGTWEMWSYFRIFQICSTVTTEPGLFVVFLRCYRFGLPRNPLEILVLQRSPRHWGQIATWGLGATPNGCFPPAVLLLVSCGTVLSQIIFQFPL